MRIPGRRTLQRAATDEVPGLSGDGRAHANVSGQRGAVRIRSDMNVAFLQTHDLQRFHAASNRSERSARGPELLQSRFALVRGNVDLVAKFTGEASAQNP